MKDVIIVGAGPIGCFTGERLADKGFNVTIIEEHSEIGHPMCCAGIVGDKELKEMGIDPRNWSLNSLKMGKVHDSDGKTLKLSRDKVEAHVINRSGFDKDMAIKATRNGAKIRLSSRVIGFDRRKDCVIVKVKEENSLEKLKTRLVIGADGTNSIVARNFGLIEEFSPTICTQAILPVRERISSANVLLDKKLSKTFFGWIAPAGKTLRVGIGDQTGNIRKKLLNFVNGCSILPRNSTDDILGITTGMFPRTDSRKIFDDRVLLVGDAAGHVKPLTGGGIYLGLSCASIATKVVESGLETSPKFDILEEYRKKVDEKFGKEFFLGKKAKKIFNNMNNEDISNLLHFFQKKEVKSTILEKAEFDSHSEIILELIKNFPKSFGSLKIRDLVKYVKWAF